MCRDVRRHSGDQNVQGAVDGGESVVDLEAATLSGGSDFGAVLVAGSSPHLWYCASRGFVLLPLPSYTSYYTVYEEKTEREVGELEA